MNKPPFKVPFWFPAAMSFGPLAMVFAFLTPINTYVTFGLGLVGATAVSFSMHFLYRRLCEVAARLES